MKSCEEDSLSNLPLLGFSETVTGSSLTCQGADVRLLQTPPEYYAAILHGIRNAKSDIILCALYFGTESQELNVINEIRLALSRAPALCVRIIFDHSRTLRKGDSSLHHFREALGSFHERVQISLYKMPLIQVSNFNKEI